MSRKERERLRDIRDAIAAIHGHLDRAGRGSAGLEDPALHDALLFRFVVIGEAVKNLSAETRATRPDIPWSAVAGLRDLIAHEYSRIGLDRILAVVEQDLPMFESAIEGLLDDEEPG